MEVKDIFFGVSSFALSPRVTAKVVFKDNPGENVLTAEICHHSYISAPVRGVYREYLLAV